MDKEWRPVENNIIRDAALRSQILAEGILKTGNIGKEAIQSLKAAFDQYHAFNKAGMFYSLYSKNDQYRKETNDIIIQILKPVFDKYFIDYKSSFNIFILKGPETNEEFFIHQDPSYIDELRYSPLHVWIPLDNITADNGALCFVPKSHNFFAPYRNISFDPPFERIRPFVRQYLEPIYAEAGEMLIFDPRLLHNSLPNKTAELRVVVLCGLFPQEADIISCFRENDVKNSPVELFKQTEDFFTTYHDFFETCRMRPTIGEPIGTKAYDYDYITESQFAAICDRHNVKPMNFLTPGEAPNCLMHGEPVTS